MKIPPQVILAEGEGQGREGGEETELASNIAGLLMY